VGSIPLNGDGNCSDVIDPERVRTMVANLVMLVLDEPGKDALVAAAKKLGEDLMALPGSWWTTEMLEACRVRLTGLMRPSSDLEAVQECCGLIVHDVHISAAKHDGDNDAFAADIADTINDWTPVFCGLPRGEYDERASDQRGRFASKAVLG
jgi:hypothetical protein